MINTRIMDKEIASENTFEDDFINREKEVKNLTALIEHIVGPSTISINSPWGTGKTHFVKMLKRYLSQEKNLKCIYFNAWESDYVQDPLVPFLAHMDEVFSEGTNEKWNTVKEIGLNLAKRSLPILVKVATTGVIDLDKEYEKAIGSFSEGLVKDAVKNFKSNKNSINNFQKKLSEHLSDQPSGKIVLFIDELDRCRPTYTIELLERVKHLFNIKEIIFILSVDKVQLCESIKAIYGSGFDAATYLKRFIDLEYMLARPDNINFIKRTFDTFELNDFFQKRTNMFTNMKNEHVDLTATLDFFSRVFEMTLRDIQQILIKIRIILLSTKENFKLYPILTTTLLVVKEYSLEAYQKYIDPLQDELDMIDYLHSLVDSDIKINDRTFYLIERDIILGKLNHNEIKERPSIIRYSKAIEVESISKDEKKYIDFILRFADHTSYGDNIDLKYVVEKIDLLEQFNFNHT